MTEEMKRLLIEMRASTSNRERLAIAARILCEADILPNLPSARLAWIWEGDEPLTANNEEDDD